MKVICYEEKFAPYIWFNCYMLQSCIKIYLTGLTQWILQHHNLHSKLADRYIIV